MPAYKPINHLVDLACGVTPSLVTKPGLRLSCPVCRKVQDSIHLDGDPSEAVAAITICPDCINTLSKSADLDAYVGQDGHPLIEYLDEAGKAIGPKSIFNSFDVYISRKSRTLPPSK